MAEYAAYSTYWYVPKARTLNDKNATSMAAILRIIFDEFLDEVWNPDTQDALLDRLVDESILEPYSEDATLADRTALVRIWKKLLEMLGLLWVQDDKEVVITDAGFDLIAATEPHHIIENQIAKLQYPNPSLAGGYRDDFAGILPHLFLLQVLQRCSYRITHEEYELFVNLAQGQDDLEHVVRYIQSWRDLTETEKNDVLKLADRIPMGGARSHSRRTRIRLNSSYQRALLTYPSYLEQQEDDSCRYILCNAPSQLNQLVEQKLHDLKIASFDSLEDWFAYFGDPNQEPSWFTYLSLEVEKATTVEQAQEIVEEHRSFLSKDEAEEIERKQVEKGIEAFYADNLHLLEDGLGLIERQYSTPIGRIDLLCRSQSGQYVIVEVKADEATDSVFGQILRYIGWVHRNLKAGENNVRGIILASKFSDKARYSRIGLLRDDYRTFLSFKEHGLYVSDI